MSSADDAASTPEARWRSPRWRAAVVVAVLAVLSVVRVSTSDAGGIERLEQIGVERAEATAAKGAGTLCVGWPRELTPSVKPTPVEGAVVVWGDRARFHLRNAAAEPVQVVVEIDQGKLGNVEGSTSATTDQRLTYALAAGAEATFTATCLATELRLEVEGGGVEAFAFGTGEQPSPVVLEKRRAG